MKKALSVNTPILIFNYTNKKNLIRWKIQERDIVRTLVDKQGFQKWSKVVVVSIYLGFPVCEVEIVTKIIIQLM